MNTKSLRAYIAANRSMFENLARCGSVSELTLRLVIYGKKWNRWSWAVFIYFLLAYKSLYCNRLSTLLNDILKTIDEDTALDRVMTDKVVVKTILQIINDQHYTSGENITVGTGLLCVLAHVFMKFPKLWNVNWMYIRHTTSRKNVIRTHRLAYLMRDKSHSAEYFKSVDFMTDFIQTFGDCLKNLKITTS